jgi:MoaA/NifB/PqqE/SkfB family radical SAM enzyme
MNICDLKLGYSCNNSCVHCVIADDRDTLEECSMAYDLKTGECIQILDTYKSAGIEHIVLTGGEVTLRPDFIEIVQYCKNLGFSIGIQTNGRKFSDMGLCSGISDVKNISFTVALHGHNEDVHDTVTGMPGSFVQTVQGIRNLRSLGKRVTAKVVISKYNIGHLTDILKLLPGIGVKKANFTFPHALGGARKNFDTVVPRYSDIKEELTGLIEAAQENDMQIDFEAIPFCIIPWYPDYVGELYDLQDANRFFKPVSRSTSDWNQVRRAIKRHGSRCGECCYGLICEGPWKEYIEHFGDGELEPVPLSPEAAARLFSKILKIS